MSLDLDLLSAPEGEYIYVKSYWPIKNGKGDKQKEII
jgi:hypothetical protein